MRWKRGKGREELGRSYSALGEQGGLGLLPGGRWECRRSEDGGTGPDSGCGHGLCLES